MQKKRKILWISIAWVCGILFVVGLTIHFAFRLKNVDVEFQLRLSEEQTHLENGIQDKVKAYFECNDNIILMKFDEATFKAESENPYLKINSIIKVFPNTIRVYISERIPKFKVKDNTDLETWLVLDEDFKVLDKISEGDENFDSLEGFIEISETNLSLSLNKGEFVTSNETCKNFINQIAVGVYGVTEDYSAIKSISFEVVENEYQFSIIMKNNANADKVGGKIIIKGELNLKNKVYAGIKTFEESLSDGSLTNDSSSTITVLEVDGRLVAIKN